MRGRPRPYWRDRLIVSLAVGVIGVTFGVFADAAGFDLPRILVMSALVFTGASQFAAVGVIEDGGTGGAAVGSALLLAARNALYGPVVRWALPISLLARLGAAHFVIDETTAMAVARAERRDAVGAFWFTGLTLWLCWNGGSLAGAVLGSVMGEPETWGLDAAFPAIFVALLATHLATAAGRTAALVAAAVALGAVPFSASGIPILLSVAALAPALYVKTRRTKSPDRGGCRRTNRRRRCELAADDRAGGRILWPEGSGGHDVRGDGRAAARLGRVASASRAVLSPHRHHDLRGGGFAGARRPCRGVVAGALAAWRKAPLIVVVLAAMAVTAGLRAVV